MAVRRLTEEGVRKLKPTPGRQVRFFDKGMPLGLATKGGLVLVVSPGGAKSWNVLYYVDKVAKYHKLGRHPAINLKSARAAATAFLENPDDALAREQIGTFPEIARQFMTRHVLKTGLRTAAEVERCFRRYVSILVEQRDDEGNVSQVVVGPRWREKKFLELRRRDVADLLDAIKDEHGARMADAVLSHLRKLMGWFATRNDDYTPVIVRGMNRSKPTSERARRRILTDDEIRRVWAACDDLGRFGGIVRLLLLTGQRLTKVVTMRWADVDDNGIWTIATERREKGNAGQLQLPRVALDVIASQPKIAGCAYVFPATYQRSDKAVRGPFHSAADGKARLDAAAKITDWVLHDLRRSARSLMSRAGVPNDHAERVLGHAIAGVEGVYNRYDFAAEKAAVLEKLAALVHTIVHPTPSNVVPMKRAQSS